MSDEARSNVVFFSDIDDKLATFSRERLSRHRRSGVGTYWHARIGMARDEERREEKEGFSRTAGASILDSLHSSPIDKSSILLIDPPNAIRVLRPSLHFFSLDSPFAHSSVRYSVSCHRRWWEHCRGGDERSMRKGVRVCRWINLIYERPARGSNADPVTTADTFVL